MNPEQHRRETFRLREEIATIERALLIATGEFKQLFEEHRERIKTRLEILEEHEPGS
jgi:hypothetical protein